MFGNCVNRWVNPPLARLVASEATMNMGDLPAGRPITPSGDLLKDQCHPTLPNSCPSPALSKRLRWPNLPRHQWGIEWGKE